MERFIFRITTQAAFGLAFFVSWLSAALVDGIQPSTGVALIQFLAAGMVFTVALPASLDEGRFALRPAGVRAITVAIPLVALMLCWLLGGGDAPIQPLRVASQIGMAIAALWIFMGLITGAIWLHQSLTRAFHLIFYVPVFTWTMMTFIFAAALVRPDFSLVDPFERTSASLMSSEGALTIVQVIATLYVAIVVGNVFRAKKKHAISDQPGPAILMAGSTVCFVGVLAGLWASNMNTHDWFLTSVSLAAMTTAFGIALLPAFPSVLVPPKEGEQ